MDILSAVTDEYKRDDIPEFGVGDTVRVHIKIKEGSRERIQVFEGFVLKRQNGGISETFTVRRIASGIGVEKTFPLHSPKIDKIELVRKGDVRRAKLNYMREKTGKSAKIKAKVLTEEQIAAEKAAEEAARQEAAEKAELQAQAEAEAAAKIEADAAGETEAEEAPEEAQAEEAPAEAEAPAEEAAEEAPAEEAQEEAPAE
jgi:large subunit ribosomal protein L19